MNEKEKLTRFLRTDQAIEAVEAVPEFQSSHQLMDHSVIKEQVSLSQLKQRADSRIYVKESKQAKNDDDTRPSAKESLLISQQFKLPVVLQQTEALATYVAKVD